MLAIACGDMGAALVEGGGAAGGGAPCSPPLPPPLHCTGCGGAPLPMRPSSALFECLLSPTHKLTRAHHTSLHMCCHHHQASHLLGESLGHYLASTGQEPAIGEAAPWWWVSLSVWGDGANNTAALCKCNLPILQATKTLDTVSS